MIKFNITAELNRQTTKKNTPYNYIRQPLSNTKKKRNKKQPFYFIFMQKRIKIVKEGYSESHNLEAMFKENY